MEAVPILRDFKITKILIEKYGTTDSCAGCDGHMTGKFRKHSSACRARIESRMKEAGDVEVGRLASRDVRLKRQTEGQEPTMTSGEAMCPLDGLVMQPEAEDTEDEVEENEPTPEGEELNRGSKSTEQIDEDMGLAEFHRHCQDIEADSVSFEPQPKEDANKNAKRRRLEQIAKKICRSLNICSNKFEGYSSERLKVERMTSALERGQVDEPRRKRMDITRVINAVSELEGCSPHETDEQERARWEELYWGQEFYDDVHEFKHLDREQVIKARMLELDFFRKMGVYQKVHKSYERGKKVISTRWVDTNKGDEKNPDYRSRLVGREIKKDSRMDLFSATPPLEVMKLLLSTAAQGQKDWRPLRVATVDIKRAYFYAPVRREVYIKIPDEDVLPGEEDMVGLLKLSLYGTRDAAQNWAKTWGEVLTKLGFVAGKASPCNYLHKSRNIMLTCHGDDFLMVAPHEELLWLIEKMKENFELKAQMLGPEKGSTKEIRILNRLIRWTGQGIEYEADQRHSQKIVSDLRLKDAKTVATPCSEEPEMKEDKEIEDPLEEWQTETKFRAVAARLNYLALDRSDLQYASNCVSKHMSKPSPRGWRILKRVGRYLKGNERLVQRFPWAEKAVEIDAHGDSDWAGDRQSGKSTSGGVISIRGHVVKTWSSTQQTIATSSGEAELYAITKAATQTVGIISIMQDFGITMTGKVWSDSTAAIGIVCRSGLGRTRHIRVQYLWLQQEVEGGILSINKVDTKANVADLMTKSLKKEDVLKFLKIMNMELRRKIGKDFGI